MCARRTIRLAACSSRAELEAIAALCQQHDAFAVTDEIYEHIYTKASTSRWRRCRGWADRTITISGASKTYSVTDGASGRSFSRPTSRRDPESQRLPDRRCAGPRCRKAIAVGMETLGDDYYEQLKRDYRRRRDILWPG